MCSTSKLYSSQTCGIVQQYNIRYTRLYYILHDCILSYYCILQLANYLHDELFSIPREFLENDASVAVQIAWDMLILNPPAIACKPRKYRESWHIDYGPRWDKKKSTAPENLVYFSPMLLLGAGGPVVSKALVGNKGNKQSSKGSSVDKLQGETAATENPESEVCYICGLFTLVNVCIEDMDGACGAELSKIMALCTL